ncbi:MAG: AAA family ATPase [bacterium]|nr:AAA family ATPase [bacterium]
MINHKYDPRLKSREELERTFICGERILQGLLEEFQPSESAMLSYQSWLITGPRGAGKSHLLTLLYHRIRDDREFAQYWWPLLFPEELFMTSSLYGLLLEVFRLIFKSAAAHDVPETIRAEFDEIKSTKFPGNVKQKESDLHFRAKRLLQLLESLHKASGKRFILMLENMQHLLGEQLRTDDARLLRSFMNEHPDVLILLGTALTVFNEVIDYGKPFYHFFRLRAMENLECGRTIEFLRKLATGGQDGIERKIRDNGKYIYLYHLLTGGNPRLVLFLYELLLSNDELDTSLLLEKISEMTPYFLDKLRHESGQRRRILGALADGAPAQSVREIADSLDENYKSIAEQLKRLADEGWVQPLTIKGEGIKKNEVFYSLCDYFFRIWYQLRSKGIEDSAILCLSELVVVSMEQKEIRERLGKHLEGETRDLYARALELSNNGDFMRNIGMLAGKLRDSEEKEVDDLGKSAIQFILDNNGDKMIETGETLLRYGTGKCMGFNLMGMGKEVLNRPMEAIQDYREALRLRPENGSIWINLCKCCFRVQKYRDAYEAFSEAVFYLDDDSVPGARYIAAVPIIKELETCAQNLFTIPEEIKRLEPGKPLTEKIEAVCRLLLLRQYDQVNGALDELLEEPELPRKEAITLETILASELLTLLQEGALAGPLSSYWERLLFKMVEKRVLSRTISRLLVSFKLLYGEDASMEIAGKFFQPFKTGGNTEVADIVLLALSKTMKSGNRELSVWAKDPLFAAFMEEQQAISSF